MKKFCDLLWTVRTIDEFENKYQCNVTRSHILRILNDSFLGGRRTKQPSAILELLIEMDLLKVTIHNMIFMTDRGKKLISLDNNNGYELSEAQKKHLISWYIPLNLNMNKDWIRNFKVNLSGEHQALRTNIPYSLQQWTEEMLYLGVVVKTSDILTLKKEYLWLGGNLVSTAPMTLDELQAKLKKQSDAGKAAEDHAVTYEKKRLRSLGFFAEAEKVECISESIVNAGYDILSYSSQSLEPDRFIEVKSFNSGHTFYWSRNELEVAKFLGDSYFLYLVTHSESKQVEIRVIQNPYSFILANANIEPVQYEINL
ncbi:DUF3883 domain-containing protein [Planococcus salinarum]|uniref:DUF3883 domain-containing protein n=1 Tax=Planococcus salinarum TaxID=622695 RepID=UPI000E3C5806|nr:DUF3883 domain-containing protein [Planococcus salinarum]TAA73142.1 DUF3883 domain-containing protein [Planococcus salinarum]